jgi:hypothetical protein
MGKRSNDTKTICLTIRLWTDDAQTPGKSLPRKHAVSAGTLSVRANPRHGIKAGKAVTLPSLGA